MFVQRFPLFVSTFYAVDFLLPALPGFYDELHPLILIKPHHDLLPALSHIALVVCGHAIPPPDLAMRQFASVVVSFLRSVAPWSKLPVDPGRRRMSYCRRIEYRVGDEHDG